MPPSPAARIALAALAVTGAAFPAIALAQEGGMTIAEGLFRDGRALIEQGKIDEACAKFDASQRMAPALGTELNLALCRERQGRTATAWTLFADVEAIASRRGDDARASIAHQHWAALAAQLAKIAIDVPKPAPGMIVKLDGTSLPQEAIGAEIPADPGDHTIVVTAPGKKTWTEPKLTLAAAPTTVRVRVALEDETADTPASPLTTEHAATPAAAVPSDVSPSPHAEGANTKRVAGYVTGGVGIVLLGVASYYGVTALSRKNDQANYPAGTPQRLAVYNEAKTAEDYELAIGAVALGALGAAAYLVLTSHAPSAGHAAQGGVHLVPAIGQGTGGAALFGSF